MMEKQDAYIQQNVTQPYKRVEPCHLQPRGWILRVLCSRF